MKSCRFSGIPGFLALWMVLAPPPGEGQANNLLVEGTEMGGGRDTREVEPGVLYDDFEDGAPGPVFHGAGKPPTSLKVVRDKDGQALHLKGTFHTRVYFSEQDYDNCTVETRMRKDKGNYAGVVVRDNIYVYLQMRGALCVSTEHGGLLYQSGQAFRGDHDLKVVCVGPTLRASMDGIPVCTVEVGERTGRVGFYSHGRGEGYYHDFRVSRRVDPLDALVADPEAVDDQLVFAPGETVRFGVRATNHGDSPQEILVQAQAKPWDGPAHGEARREKLTLAAGQTVVVPVELGPIPEGFHKIECSVRCGETAIAEFPDLPLAIQHRGQGDFTAPVYPMSVYSKYFGSRNPLYRNTYAHAVARILRDHRFNAIVADPSFTDEIVEIFGSYGLATIARGGGRLKLLTVIGTLSGDEPKPQHIENLKKTYQALAAQFDKPVTTCMVGEGMGLGGDHDPVNLWRQLDATVRAFRWYGIKKSHYGLLHDLKYKGVLPLSSVLRIAEATADTPWWFVPPSFGSTAHEGYFQNPSPAQMKGLMHMALAHGADGMMLWCLQGWGGKGTSTALIDQKTLQPPDGKLAAAGDVAGRVAKHGPLLQTLRYGHFEVGNSNPFRMEVVPRRDTDGGAYLYVVNRDETAPASATLSCRVGPGTAVTDLYTGKRMESRTVKAGGWEIDVALQPGEGALLDLNTRAAPPEPRETPATAGTALDSKIVAAAKAAAARNGAAVLSVRMDASPSPSGDGIGLLGNDDPRAAWARDPASPRCLNWSGGLHARTAPGYLPLASALRLAEADATRASSDVPDVETEAKSEKAGARFWVAYPAAGDNGTPPGELRAMLHLALAYGAEVALVPESASAELSAVASEVGEIARVRGETLAALKHGGLDVRCKEPRVAAVPRALRMDDTYRNCVYVVNLDPENEVTADVLLWQPVWDWTTARDAFSERDLDVRPPPDEEGYLTCTVTLHPGEGKLLITDAKVKPRK